jgi:hypothetical protein
MIQKYGAALVSILLAGLVFLKTAFADDLDYAEVAQLVAIVAGAVVIYFLPLVKGPWAGALKTIAAILMAAATAVGPLLLQGTITFEQWTIVAIAVLNALGVEIGSQARKSVLIDAGTVTPGTAAVITSIPDPEGAKALGV